MAQEFCQVLKKKRNAQNEISDLRVEVGKWSLENAGSLIFDKRLGCFGENEKLGLEMARANEEIFKVNSQNEISYTF